MDAFSNNIAGRLRDALANRIVELSGRLAIVPAADFPGYRERVGHIAGLKDALATLAETERELERPEGAKDTAQPSASRRYEA